MKKMLLLIVVLLAVTAPVFADLVNGNWSTSDETGWTRWRAPWGSSEQWAVTINGPTCPEGTLSGGGGNGSFGWFQVIECPVGATCTVSADWAGNIGGSGWAEVMFWTTSNPNEDHGARGCRQCGRYCLQERLVGNEPAHFMVMAGSQSVSASKW